MPAGRPARSSRRAIFSRWRVRIDGATRGPSRVASPPTTPRGDRAAARRRPADAAGQPLQRPAVEHHRHAEQPDGDEQRGERAGEQRRHTSTRVVRRISTKATAHSVPVKTSVAIPASDVAISRITPGAIRFMARIAPTPIPTTR